MNFPFVALSLDITEDLLPLSAVLQQRGLAHQVVEENGQQVLRVAQEVQVQQVVDLYRGWRAGEFTIERVPGPDKRNQATGAARLSRWYQTPVTCALIALSIAGFLLIYLRAPYEWLSILTYSPFSHSQGQIQFQGASGEYWRLVTPAFLHFGWLHVAFNSLWMWELGAKVERTLGAVNLLLLFIVIAIVSNTAQYVFGGPGLFGGMSGVVYGLLGFSWVGARIQPAWQFQPPKPVMLMMVGWLLFCMAGVIEVLGFGAIANAAHMGGLLVGAVLGAAFAFLSLSSGDKA